MPAVNRRHCCVQVIQAAREVQHSLPSASRPVAQATTGAHASEPLSSSVPAPEPMLAAADSPADEPDVPVSNAPVPASPQHCGDRPPAADMDVEAGPAAADTVAADTVTAAVAQAAEIAAVKRKAAATPGSPAQVGLG
jgi:hypothetical protein